MNATFAHKALSLLLTACILLSPFPITHAASGSSYAVPFAEVGTHQASELQDPVKGGSELPYEDHERVRASIVLEEPATLMQGYRGAVPKHV